MRKSRQKEVADALAINSLGGVEPDKEVLELFNRYANHEFDYNELSRLIDEYVSDSIKKHGIISEC